MIKVNILATGSTGNCVILNDAVMVDCGVSFKLVSSYLDKVKLVLITHEHQDHFLPSTIRRMATEKPLLRFGCGPWMVKKLLATGVKKSQINVLYDKMLQPYNLCSVLPVPVFHDVQNYAYKIFFPNKEKVFYCTDMGHLNGVNARGYDLYLVENNYKEDELQARMDAKLAEGKYPYEMRVRRYHMSEEQITNWLYANMDQQKSEYIFLHKHVDRGATRYEGVDSGL